MDIMLELKEYILFIGQGIFLTLELLFGGILIGLILGTIFSILRYQGYLVYITNILISVLRGTPLILQLAIVYFAVPGIFNVRFNILTTGIITFGLNSFAYVMEILRAGIENIPKGQFEAAQTLQIPAFYMWKDIILPQVIKNILPAMVNEIISLLKETALISTIGGMDIMRYTQTLSSERFTYFLPLCVAGGYYYMLVLVIEFIGKKLEKRL